MGNAQMMIPCTNSIMSQMMAKVLEVLLDRGLVEPSRDEEEATNQVVRLCEAQGIGKGGNVPLGRCLLLPQREGELFSLLAVTPWPADLYGEELHRLPSPVRFRRNDRNEIILPGRFLLAKLDELATNPAAPKAVRALAVQLSRRALPKEFALPTETQTIAIGVNESDGTTKMIETLPAGLVISVSAKEYHVPASA